ncbi:MAG: cyclomaltodextrinase N-terminal domain-containing protein [Ignavibacterium sp.]|nr:MAG: cyclomaltodextrinase N-terminal domain-containing protein [Ignavibacterium sp.]
MKWNKVQLMIYGKNLDNSDVTFEDERLEVVKIHSVENPSYLFVDFLIPDDLPEGEYTLTIFKGDEEIKHDFPVLSREFTAESHQGFSNEDVIYLIFADRFCDGNPSNNIIGDSLDEFTSNDLDGRQGGDIEGIMSKLAYIKELGITTIWITPMLENNMWMSYHGYAATDLYKIDPRFGSNWLYKRLVQEAHKRDIKVILDHVSNHIGINHPWIKNLPTYDWLNGTPENHIPANHDKMAFLDNYGDSTILKFTTEGWFEDYMPDLNQRNSLLKRYLMQNTLWWIEYSGLDGIREDTYPYSDQKYLSEWADAILKEYPNFNIVGEIWKGIPSIISGYQDKSPVREHDFESNLPAVTDFAFADALRWYLSGDKNIYQVYETIAQDIVYNDPDNLIVFLDNHDIERAMFIADGNVEKFKIGLNLILFTRGIPVIFYGTEIGISGGKHHGELRQPFPGGFDGDDRYAFMRSERTTVENEIFEYLTELLKLRKEYPVLYKGTMRHIYGGGDLYVIIKEYENQQVMIVFNTGETDVTIKPFQIQMTIADTEKLVNLKSNKEIQLADGESITLKGLTTEMFLLEK